MIYILFEGKKNTLEILANLLVAININLLYTVILAAENHGASVL